MDEDAPKSLREPQLEPSDHCMTILTDFGPANGGWGPAAVMLPGFSAPGLFVYTGSDEMVMAVMPSIARNLAQETGRPTRLVRYSKREDVFVVGGSS